MHIDANVFARFSQTKLREHKEEPQDTISCWSADADISKVKVWTACRSRLWSKKLALQHFASKGRT